MDSIIQECPQFYPAMLDAGARRLFGGDDVCAEKQIKEGVVLMLDLAGPQALEKELDSLLDNLEKTWRFDICQSILEPVVKRFPENSTFRDCLAHAAVRMGNTQSALLHIGRAVELEPKNKDVWSNQGWMQLMAGNLKEALFSLEKALSLDKKNKVVKGNLEIHGYLSKHGGNYFDYLVRPLDKERIDRLADEEEWEKVDELCDDYNSSRMEAMAQDLLLEGGKKRSALPEIISTLRAFFGFAAKLSQEGYFLQEELLYIGENFKAIMHKFIFKMGDVDRRMIEEIYEALFEYYGFLARRSVVSCKDFGWFHKEILGMKAELMEKMKKYNAVRHDNSMDEKKKEALRAQLFEGDHEWPHI
ncbi:MAG: hypothetical protein HY747_01505 [Elusimicrobia bacterium]|nr:hypothetical protein [Elusimicrobiota bacterium]